MLTETPKMDRNGSGKEQGQDKGDEDREKNRVVSRSQECRRVWYWSVVAGNGNNSELFPPPVPRLCWPGHSTTTALTALMSWPSAEETS